MKALQKRVIASLMIILLSFQTCFTSISYADTSIEQLEEREEKEDKLGELEIATPGNAKPKEDEDNKNIEDNKDSEDNADYEDDEEMDSELENDLEVATPGNAKPKEEDKPLKNDLLLDNLDLIDFSLKWGDSEFTNGNEFNLVEGRNEAVNEVKLVVSYSNDAVGDTGYDIGELKIRVKGIGGVNRDRTIEAKVAADKESSETKVKDWSYTWDSETDVYEFRNNKRIEHNAAFSGFFELVWEINARKSIHNYLQDNIEAEFFINEVDEPIISESLSFKNETVRDEFSVEIAKGEMHSTEGLTDKLENPDDYNFIRYDMAVVRNSNTRGLSEDTFIFNPDVNNVGSGAVVLSSNKNYKDRGDGTYEIDLAYSKIDSTEDYKIKDQYIYVAYPKSEYTIDKNFEVGLDMYGTYYEENEEELLASSKITIYPSKDFEFAYISEGKYWFNMESYYDYHNKHHNGRDISGSKMKNGTTETFYITGGLGDIKKEDGVYTLEVADDFMYIQKNDGDYRRLEDDEYEFKNITIPSRESFGNINGVLPENGDYTIKVYGVKSTSELDKLFNKSSGTLIKSVDISEYSEVVYFPKGIVAISICIEGVTSSIKQFEFPVQVYFKLNDRSHLSFEEQDNLTDGKLINTGYDREYKNEVWVEPNIDESGYVDDTSLNIAQQDKDTYGHYLVRNKGDIKFYEGGQSDYRATSSIDNDTIIVKDDGIEAIYSMGAYFSFENEDYPNKFSLYTIFPEDLKLNGYEIKEDIWDIMELEGLGLSERELAQACTPRIDLNYKNSGRTYIRLDFDFGDKELRQLGDIKAFFKVKASEDKSIYVQNCVMINKKIDEYTYNKQEDDGSWGDDTDLFKDINNDGITSSLLASSQAKYIKDNSASSSEFRVLKFSRTMYSNGWVQSTPIVEYGGDYQYRLCLRNGSGSSKNIVMTDVIENESVNKGIFQSVEVQGGLNPTIYYSNKTEPSDLSSGDWSTVNKGDTKSIALDFGDYVLGAGEEINVIINMKALSDISLKDQIMKNKYSVELDIIDGKVQKHDILNSNIASVKLSPLLRKIVVTKKDSSNQEVLEGAEFVLLDKNGNVIDEAVSNRLGYAILSNIPSELGVEYTLRETKAPIGYETIEDQVISMTNDHIYIDICDDRKLGSVKVYKTNNLSKDVLVSGASYTLYDENNNEIASGVTDENGLVEFNNIEWGNYKIRETQAPNGYELNNQEYQVKINKYTVDNEIIINTMDIQSEVNIRIIKYVSDISGNKTKETLEGIKFELINEKGKRVGLYETNENGEININNISYGKYHLREYSTLDGYIKSEDMDFELSPETPDLDIEVYNQREPGNMIITKSDNLGNLVSGVEFSLYDETKENIIRKNVTDGSGMVKFDNLEWGTYYLKETKTPEYYQASEEFIEVKISRESREAMLKIVNETVKGSVVLTKVDEETKSHKLSGAKYTLYTINNVPINTYVTDENGRIEVKDLEWGSYYFKEVEAPSGYGISNENIRFSINAMNAGVVQEVTAIDPQINKYIKITKTIYADDINFAHGFPQFMFKVVGLDINDVKHTYTRMMTFDEDYVKNNVDSNGYVSQSIVIGGLTAGIYDTYEEKTVRYELSELVNIVNGEASKELTRVSFDLRNDEAGYGEVEFVNRNNEQQKYSHTSSVNNIVKENSKPTAIKVEYADNEVLAQGKVDKDKLTVLVIYDDGSTRELTSDEYELSSDTFPNVNGDYNINVKYTENGVTVKGSDSVTISGMVEQIIQLKGSLIDKKALEVGTEITEDMLEVIDTYNTGETRVLEKGEYIISPKIVPGTSLDFDIKISLNIPNNGVDVETKVNAQVNLREPLLETGVEFNKHIKDDTYEIEFSDIAAPNEVETFDVSALKNHSVVAWHEGNKLIVSSQRKGIAVIANEDSSKMFSRGDSYDNNITRINASNLNTSNIINMYKMFYNCTKLTQLDGGWTLDKVENMAYAFTECTSLEYIDTSRWKTENVRDMSHLFSNCYKLRNIDTSNWKTENVTNMAYMFSSCRNLNNINTSNWETRNATDMQYMFYNCDKISELDTSKWDTSNVTDMKYMFRLCRLLGEIDMTSWNTSNVTNMAYMFSDCQALTSLKIGETWNTINVTDMNHMFYSCSRLNSLDVSKWDTSNATDMNNMFYGCAALSTLVFSDTWKTDNVRDMSLMFYGCSVLSSVNVSKWDTSKVENMKQMFSYCVALTSLDVSNWDTSNVTDMFSMFRACRVLDGLSVGNWKTGNVTDMSEMFCDCNNLKTLDVARWDTSKVTSMQMMFTYCGLLSRLDVVNWKTENVINMKQTFEGCWSMTVCNCSNWNVSKVTDHTRFRANGDGQLTNIKLPKDWATE